MVFQAAMNALDPVYRVGHRIRIASPKALLNESGFLNPNAFENLGGSHMGGGISNMAKEELVVTIRDRCQYLSKNDKGRILDEFTATTGDHR